ncbi:unnamed protein product [Albugo candida]|uniref:Secreted protein n=1 Tax=Albugo candida TaxID=65357 RepID=A0A024G4E9_9STRA|nr:unnamed protein product [Albugo candida]|eukprot:CCI41392.1 unnamed protein product [Albugo candida]
MRFLDWFIIGMLLLDWLLRSSIQENLSNSMLIPSLDLRVTQRCNTIYSPAVQHAVARARGHDPCRKDYLDFRIAALIGWFGTKASHLRHAIRQFLLHIYRFASSRSLSVE